MGQDALTIGWNRPKCDDLADENYKHLDVPLWNLFHSSIGV
jgi:hypothetical protein